MKKEVVGKNKDGKDVTVIVKSPSAEQHSLANLAAQRLFANLMNEVDESGKHTAILRAQLDKILDEKGLWNEGKEKELTTLVKSINEARRKLLAGGVKLSEGKKLSVKIRELNFKLDELRNERRNLEQFSAESKTESERIDNLIIQCVLKDDGTPFFESVEHYRNAPQEPWMVEAAKAIGEVIFGVDAESEKKLPENKFLLKYGFANDKGQFVNKDGKLVDEDGRLINEHGRYIDVNGGFVDRDGNPVDADGLPVVEYSPFLDDDGNPVE